MHTYAKSRKAPRRRVRVVGWALHGWLHPLSVSKHTVRRVRCAAQLVTPHPHIYAAFTCTSAQCYCVCVLLCLFVSVYICVHLGCPADMRGLQRECPLCVPLFFLSCQFPQPMRFPIAGHINMLFSRAVALDGGSHSKLYLLLFRFVAVCFSCFWCVGPV